MIHSVPEKPMPHSIEAEQQLLGALMLDNGLVSKVGTLTPDAFYEPTHGRIFDAIAQHVERGELASPVTLKLVMAHDEGLRELGGSGYLARLAGAAISGHAIRDYAEMIADAAARRDAIGMIEAASDALRGGSAKAGDVLSDLEAALVSMAPATSKMRPVSILAATNSAIAAVNSMYQGEDFPSVMPPWFTLSQIIPAFRAGDMVVIGGRPSMGKSAVALSIATDAARKGHPVVFASFEMTPEDVALRAISEATSIEGKAVAYQSLSSPDLREDQFRGALSVAQEVAHLPIQFLTEDFRNPGALMSGARRALRSMAGADKTPLIIVDYMQLMDGKGRDLREQITHISKQMKHLAKSVGGVNISLSQLSRNVEQRQDKRPMLSDLRESGQIEQDADMILFCYRDEYYVERERPDERDLDAMADWQDRMDKARGRLELIVGKNRRGPIGTAHLNCALAYNRIWEANA